MVTVYLVVTFIAYLPTENVTVVVSEPYLLISIATTLVISFLFSTVQILRLKRSAIYAAFAIAALQLLFLVMGFRPYSPLIQVGVLISSVPTLVYLYFLCRNKVLN